MGKKNKNKRELFERDYTDISAEEQFRMLLLSNRISNGEVVDLNEGYVGDKHENRVQIYNNELLCRVDDDSSEFDGDLLAIIPLGSDDHDENSDSLNEIIDTIKRCEVNKTKKSNKEEKLKGRKPSPDDKNILSGVTFVNKGIKNEKGDDDCEIIGNDMCDSGNDKGSSETAIGAYSDVLDDLENPTLDNQFAVLTEDMENGDLIINDAWKRYKAHSISTYNMIEATTDYSSYLYLQIRTFVHLAVAIIAGPVLMIRQGNPIFKEFIKKIKDVDKDRIFFLTKEDLDAKNDDGSPVVHILMYYIDDESNKILNENLELFEQPDDEIAIDFLYAIYSKLLDRHTNPFSQYSAIDTLIDEYSTSDDDLNFVLDLIYKDEGTVLWDNPDERSVSEAYEYFLKNISLNSIEAFLDCPQNPNGIFFLLKSVMEVHLNNADPEGEKLVIPYNFGINDGEDNEDAPAYDVVENGAEIDFDIPHYEDNCENTPYPVNKIDVSSPPRPIPTNTENQVKEFGSVPHDSEQRIIIDIG